MRILLAIASCVVVGSAACTWNPSNGSNQESSSAVTLSGWTYGSAQPVTVKVRNWDTDALTTVGTTTSGTSETIAGSGMYPWSLSVPASMFTRANWTPSNLGPSTTVSGWVPPAQLDLRPFQSTTAMYTFGAAAGQCAWDRMNNGATQQQAGTQCSDGNHVSLIDPTGFNVNPTALAWTVHSSKTVTVAGPPFRAEVVSYRSGGYTVLGMVCRPDDAAAHRTMVFNHGGAAGTDAVAAAICAMWAQRGWTVAMSAYRGEPLYVPADWGVPGFSGSIAPPNGQVETNLGEVMDVHRLIDGLRALPSVNSSKIFLWGHSHGGGITLRALETGAPVRAAAVRAPASSWADIYNDCKTASWPNGVTAGWLCTCLVNGCPPLGITSIPASFGGTPATNPRSYDWRSPIFFAKDLKVRSDVTLLVQHGVADDTVQVGQSCALALATWGSGFTNAWHAPNAIIDATSVSSSPLEDCPGITFQPAPRPTYPGDPTHPTYWQEKSSYLIVYDGLDHVFNSSTLGIDNAGNRDFDNFVNWLALTWGT